MEPSSLFDFNFWKSLDESLLLAINGMHTPMLDNLMWLLSGKWVWIPFYALLIMFMGYRLGVKQTALILISIAVMITLTDQTCATLIRPCLERLRPSHPDNPVSSMIQLVNGYRGGSFGFPSCHAANTAALATFIILLFRIRALSIFMVVWALAICYSRMYLGVHYPSDILVGMTVGIIYAILVYYAYRFVSRKIALSR